MTGKNKRTNSCCLQYRHTAQLLLTPAKETEKTEGQQTRKTQTLSAPIPSQSCCHTSQLHTTTVTAY